jgi:two-component system, NarL family, sensor histidine kinase UhpB
MTMKPTVGEDADRKISARRDIALIVAIAIAAFYLSAKYNLSEALLEWTRPLERLQVDEIPGVLLVVAICLVWFSSRRYFEANHQLLLRRAVEARLAETLAENQRLAQQYVNVQEHERKALARDLHDELGQYLNAIKLDAVSIRETGESRCGVRDASGAMIANIDRVDGVVTGLIRQLRPADLESLDETRRLVIYRLVQEALTNIARHSQATQAEIRIASARSADLGPCVDILIADNGCGADMQAPRTGLGLIGMRERVSALGGSIALSSERGAGFKIMSSLPVSGGQS